MSDQGATAERIARYLSSRLADEQLSVDQVWRSPRSTTHEVVLCTASWEVDGDERTRDLVFRMETESPDWNGERGIDRNYELLDSLADTDVPVAEPLWFDADPDAFDRRLFVTEQLSGESYRKSVPAHVRALERAWNSEERRLPESYVDVLGSIHELDAADLDGMPSRSPADVIEAELESVAETYDHIDFGYPIVDEAFRWLRRNAPDVPETTVVHGDLKMENVLVEDERVTGVLDWELARETDPMFDLAYACSPVNAGPEFEVVDGVDLCLGLFEREWLFDRYEETTGRAVDRERVDYWETYVALSNVLVKLRHAERFVRDDAKEVYQVFPQYLLAPQMKILLDSLRAGE